ncbi:MAG: ABC transporter permease [Bacteroidetes bacterium]|nr:ABC transporter permease [Bacteroidota bacterium]
MNLSYFIAKRTSSSKKGTAFTGLVKTISVLSIALSLGIMIVAVAIVTGFQKEIREKTIGFGSHIQINLYDITVNVGKPIDANQDFIDELSKAEGIKHIQVYAHQAGIIKTDDEIHGVIMKGVSTDFDWDYFNKYLTEGSVPIINDSLPSNEILISKQIANKLYLSVGDPLFLYFIQEDMRNVRRFIISGIYETGLEELDKLFVLGDLKHIQRINRWASNQVGGYEVIIKDFSRLDEMQDFVMENISYELYARTIKELYPQIFDWLDLLDMNVYVILILMIIVASINMITCLLISVLEKTNMIGILKTLGANNSLVIRVFLINAMFLIFRGLIWGNILGLGVCFVQSYFGIITLSQESYFVSVVPINFDFMFFAFLNIGTFVISFLMLILPSLIITKIPPIKAIRLS